MSHPFIPYSLFWLGALDLDKHEVAAALMLQECVAQVSPVSRCWSGKKRRLGDARVASAPPGCHLWNLSIWQRQLSSPVLRLLRPHQTV